MDDDPSRIDRDVVAKLLTAEAYWGRWRTPDHINQQFDAAWRTVGAFDSASGRLIGFARAVSDGVALAYLADVFVDADWRGRGVGVALVKAMIDDGPGADFRWMLHTADAHGLYRRFGFDVPDDTFLERPASGGKRRV